jgi:hypothetical protein
MTRSAPLAALLGALGLSVLSSLGAAQVRSPGIPTSDWAQLPGNQAAVALPTPDVAFYLAEDEVNGPFPFRYGAVTPTELDAAKTGQWDQAADGTLVWRLEIHSATAYSLGLEFSKFDLPAGATLYVYDANKRNVYGAYTELNENPDHQFVIEPFPGDVAILEYNQPRDAAGSPEIVVSGVIHDYRNVFTALHGIPTGTSVGGADGGPCLFDINCPEGANWQANKRGVVKTVSGGGLCSASLINNTNSDGQGYVLTANHCGQSANTVFYFNYETSGCATGSAPQNQTVSGCTVLTTNGTYDGRFLKLNNAIPNNYKPFYAGWSRATNGFTQATSIGHPSGGPKKISIDNNGASLASTVWNVTWNVGTLEGGSSGGPVFDQNKRIRGQAWFVNGFVCTGQSAGYGRFDQFWTNNGLAQWLAPSGTPPMTLDAYDPFGVPPAPPTVATVAPASVPAFESGQITLTGTNYGDATQVTVGGTVLTPPLGFTIVSGTQIQFFAPTPTTLGPVNVTVTNSVGTSTAKTLTYTQTLPPKLAVPPFGLTGATLGYAYGGGANDIAVLVYSGSSATIPLLGANVLSGAIVLKVQVLSNLGLGNHSPLVPASAVGLTIYSQLIDVDELNSSIVGATTPTATTILF